MESEGNQSFIEHIFEKIIENLQDTVSTEDLEQLVAQEWEVFVAKAQLSRKEADDLHQALMKLISDLAMQDEEELHNDQEDRERFLNTFPQVKMELEERIKKLRALADKIDKVHKDCTISHVVATSTGAVSGVLTILGLALAPVTAGVSLALSATGIGLRTAAAVTSVATSIVDHSSTLSAKAEAGSLLSTSMDTMKEVKNVLSQTAPRVASTTTKCIQDLQRIEKSIHVIKLAKANSRLAAKAKRLMTTGRISARSTKQVERAFGGTALAMTKGARMMGAATAGVFLLMDVISLVKESMHLHDGAKTESAAELRQRAEELEKMLEELIQIQESL
ncbi:apolipoprotein L3-like isoform X1 [Castor canadensis]|uniref:Apolipoprotein L3-like isoform X1 n=4 Tax=Castor canadensis TaxID=51338 RepID=A0AC58NFT7_CASCN